MSKFILFKSVAHNNEYIGVRVKLINKIYPDSGMTLIELKDSTAYYTRESVSDLTERLAY